MSSFSQEMLRLLQPELLQPNEMKDILIKNGVSPKTLLGMDQPTLLEFFKNVAVPKPQRRKVGNSPEKPDHAKPKNKIVIESTWSRSSNLENGSRKKIVLSSSSEKSKESRLDRFRLSTDTPKSTDEKIKSPSLEKPPSIDRLKPPPEPAQASTKKIKLNRSSSEALDNVIIKDRSKNDSARNGETDSKSITTNGVSASPATKKVTLKRQYDSSQGSGNTGSEESVPKKKTPITWP